MPAARLVLLVTAVAAVSPLPLMAQPAASLDAWNLRYTIPPGWQLGQQLGRIHGLTSGTSGAMLYVAAGMYQTFNDVAADAARGFQALGLVGMPQGQPTTSTIRGMQAMTAAYAAQNQMGVPLLVQITAVLTPHGTGLVVTGLAPMQYGTQVGAVVDQVAQSIEVGGPPRPNPQAIAALRGRWMFYSGKATGVTGATGGASNSYEETVEFDGTGRFSWQSSASVSVTTPGAGGTAGGANASSDQGAYTVIGSTLVLRGQQGQMAVDIQVLGDRIIADGKTYLRVN